MVLALICPAARADYLPKESLQKYDTGGPYPFWNASWVALDPRIHEDAQGVPFVRYRSGARYNPVTVALFALRSFNAFAAAQDTSDRTNFLKLARWLAEHQDRASGAWIYEFDFEHIGLGVTIRSPWISAMAQGLGISVSARAYRLTHEAEYQQAAERALLPFVVDVEHGGVAQAFVLTRVGEALAKNLVFFEEYPTRPKASYTLNGFMFALLGLYDFAQLGNAQAASLFRAGMQTLEYALPLFEQGSATSYDLAHLTSPPRKANVNAGYHLIHISLLNALGTTTGSRTLLSYRDRWNGSGSALRTDIVLAQRVGYFVVIRYWAPALGFLIVVLIGFAYVAVRHRKHTGQRGRE